MNKKFLSAILFGALMVTSTGTFVSCKDYDDDIANLQEQIDKKAELTELTSQVNTMQSALTAAQTAANNALSKAEDAMKAAQAADDSAEIAALQTKIDALKAELEALDVCQCDVEALKAELKDLIASSLADADLEGLKKQIADQMAVVTELAGGYLTMVTEVDLYYKEDANPDLTLNFSNVIEKDNEFGPNKEIKFSKGTNVPTPASIVVRVVPTSAELNKDMITLINGKGESVMDQVQVTNVEKYSELITRGSETGLWKISFELKKYDKDNFPKISGETGKEILYAIAVNDITATEETVAHTAVSDFGIDLAYTESTAVDTLFYNVGGTEVAQIHNRWKNSENNASTKNVEDYIWKNGAEVAIAKDKSNVIAKADGCYDNRQSQPSKNVEVGVPFAVELVANYAGVMPRAFYVTLDESHAVESAPSEINAWKSYGIKGLNTVVDPAKKLEITIPAESAKGDYIGFRVYAVNYDGTLVDPDGRAFYVYVAGATTEANASVMFKPNKYTDSDDKWKSESATINITGWAGADKAKLVKIYDKADTKKAEVNTLGLTLSNFVFVNGTTETALSGTINTAITGALDKYTKVFIKDTQLNKLVDGVTYVAEIELINSAANNTIVQRVEIEFTKVFPGFPAAVKPFTNILIGGKTLKIYPDSIKGDSVIYDIDNVWHGVDAHTLFAQTGVAEDKAPTVNYILTTTTVEAKADDGMPAFKAPKAIMVVDNDAFETKYPMAVTYDYGYLSSKDKDPDGDENDATYWTAWSNNDFELIFGNYVYDCSIVWGKTAPKLAYPGVVGETNYISLKEIKITDWYNRTTPSLANLFNGYAISFTIDLLTGEDFATENEYYTAEIKNDYVVGKTAGGQEVKEDVILLTAKSTASQGDDVPTKIRLTIKDIYGGTVVKVFDPFTMTFKK